MLTESRPETPESMMIRRLNVINGFSAVAAILVERAEAAAPEEALVLLGEAYELMGLIEGLTDGPAPDRDELDAWSGFESQGG